MSHEELIFSLIGLFVTLLLASGGLFKWATNIMSSKVDDVVKKFDENTIRVIDKFELLTDRIHDGFKENADVHEKIKLQVVEMKGDVYHIQDQIHGIVDDVKERCKTEGQNGECKCSMEK